MKRYTSLLLVLFCAWTINHCSADDNISATLRKNGYTPIFDHNSAVVPGMLLVVNWREGTYQFRDPEPDATALTLDPPSTEQLAVCKTTRVRDANAATEGLQTILGFNPSLQFSNSGTFEFSGPVFSVRSLRTDDAEDLISGSGKTATKAAELIKEPTNVYLVIEVDSTESITVSSNSTISLAGGTSSQALRNCSVTTPSSDTANSKPDANASQKSQSDNSAQSGNTATTVGALKASTQQAANAAAANPGGTIQWCSATGGSYVFTSTASVPAAAKVRKVLLDKSGKIYLDNGNYAVPINDQHKLHRACEHCPVHDRPTENKCG